MKYYADFLFLYILVSIFAALATGEVRLPGITMKPGRNQMALFAVTLILIACYMRNIGYGNRFLNHTMILTGFLAVLYSGSRTFMLFMLLIGFFTLFRRHGTFKVSDFARFSLIIVIGVLAFVGVLVLTEDLRLLNIANKFVGFVVEIEATNKNTLDEYGRIKFFVFAWEVIVNDVFILVHGVGLEAYRQFADLLKAITGKEHTLHNVYLQYLVGLGLPGLFLLLAMIVSLYSRIQRIRVLTAEE